jgi:hypothetical protein
VDSQPTRRALTRPVSVSQAAVAIGITCANKRCTDGHRHVGVTRTQYQDAAIPSLHVGKTLQKKEFSRLLRSRSTSADAVSQARDRQSLRMDWILKLLTDMFRGKIYLLLDLHMKETCWKQRPCEGQNLSVKTQLPKFSMLSFPNPTIIGLNFRIR